MSQTFTIPYSQIGRHFHPARCHPSSAAGMIVGEVYRRGLFQLLFRQRCVALRWYFFPSLHLAVVVVFLAYSTGRGSLIPVHQLKHCRIPFQGSNTSPIAFNRAND